MKHFQWRQFIIGGTEVQEFSQFAYQLSLRYVEVHVCGASIIALRWALSAGSLVSIVIFFRAGEMNYEKLLQVIVSRTMSFRIW